DAVRGSEDRRMHGSGAVRLWLVRPAPERKRPAALGWRANVSRRRGRGPAHSEAAELRSSCEPTTTPPREGRHRQFLAGPPIGAGRGERAEGEAEIGERRQREEGTGYHPGHGDRLGRKDG